MISDASERTVLTSQPKGCFRKESFFIVPGFGEEASMVRRGVLALIAVALLAASVLAQPAARAASSPRIWPRHVYAPYFETWTTDSIPAVAWKADARYFMLA